MEGVARRNTTATATATATGRARSGRVWFVSGEWVVVDVVLDVVAAVGSLGGVLGDFLRGVGWEAGNHGAGGETRERPCLAPAVRWAEGRGLGSGRLVGRLVAQKRRGALVVWCGVVWCGVVWCGEGAAWGVRRTPWAPPRLARP